MRPSKSLGQNFLIDRNILDFILRHADVSPGDRVLEIGPGLGVLTERLLSSGAEVVAIEKDARLCAFLDESLSGRGALTLVHADALSVDVAPLLAGGDVKFVSNLPYAVGSRILVELAREATPPADMVVTVQREVAGRLTAAPGRREYGLLTLWCGLRYEAGLVKTVSSTCFVPRPEVGSAVVGLARRDREPAGKKERERVYQLSRVAFQHRRKQLVSSLPAHLGCPGVTADRVGDSLARAGLDRRARPGELSPQEWVRLARLLP